MKSHLRSRRITYVSPFRIFMVYPTMEIETMKEWNIEWWECQRLTDLGRHDRNQIMILWWTHASTPLALYTSLTRVVGRPQFSMCSYIETYQGPNRRSVSLLPTQLWCPLPSARTRALVRLRPNQPHPPHLHNINPHRSTQLGLNPPGGSDILDRIVDPIFELSVEG